MTEVSLCSVSVFVGVRNGMGLIYFEIRVKYYECVCVCVVCGCVCVCMVWVGRVCSVCFVCDMYGVCEWVYVGCVCVCLWCMFISVCVCVYSRLSHPACKSRLSYAILCCPLWPVCLYHIFPLHLIHNAMFEKHVLSIKHVIWFSLQILPEKFLILRRMRRDMIISLDVE
jgi:hypothetical protein